MTKFPSSKQIVKEAATKSKAVDLNELHSFTYQLMLKYKDQYYREKVADFFGRETLRNLDQKTKLALSEEMLKPLTVQRNKGEVQYSNFMEEASRRISQTFQVISGNIAEDCIERDLSKVDLKLGENYLRKVERTDFVFYFPSLSGFKIKHRVEVKNVTLRERAIRGLSFDGDSMFGFFRDPAEFSPNTIKIIHAHCKKKNGYCYVPPSIMKALEKKLKNKRFKSNLEFSKDMSRFVKRGFI